MPSNTSDVRALGLEATAKGAALHGKILDGLVEEMKGLIAGDDPASRRATIRIVARLARAAQEKFGRRAPRCGGGG